MSKIVGVPFEVFLEPNLVIFAHLLKRPKHPEKRLKLPEICRIELLHYADSKTIDLFIDVPPY